MGTPATAHGPYTWAPYLPARLPSASAVTRVKDRFAWCEATNRTVLPVCIPYNQLSEHRGPTRVDARGRPDWIPALLVRAARRSRTRSPRAIKHNPISAEQPRTAKTRLSSIHLHETLPRSGYYRIGSVPCFDPGCDSPSTAFCFSPHSPAA